MIGARAARREDVANWLPILTFHAVDDTPSVIAFPPALFRSALEELQKAGFRTLGLLDAAERVAKREGFPARSVVLTFDDGYRSVYETVLPALHEHGMTATVFVSAGTGRGDRFPSLCHREMLSWPEVRELHAAGLEIGAHTLAHPDLTRLPADRVRQEILESKARLEEAIGAPVSSFAYPFGRFDDRSVSLVREHFRCACSDFLSVATHRSDPYLLPRVDAYYLRSPFLFAAVGARWFPWAVRLRNVPRQLRRRMGLWPT